MMIDSLPYLELRLNLPHHQRQNHKEKNLELYHHYLVLPFQNLPAHHHHQSHQNHLRLKN
jgi:hypothetical protein